MDVDVHLDGPYDQQSLVEEVLSSYSIIRGLEFGATSCDEVCHTLTKQELESDKPCDLIDELFE